MTIEYVLFFIFIFGVALKTFVSAPTEAFKQGAPRLGARIESQITIGNSFKGKTKGSVDWAENK